mgnify:CR=1 FL=1|tara:strand:- start:1704 stop:5564 length:3861 start_codon:yes stop_codon:yes gene_type:complete
MLDIPQRFKDGLNKKLSTIYPIVVIKKGARIFHLSQKKGMFDGEYYEDRGLKVSPINESIDIENKNLKTSHVSVEVSNYIYNNERFTDIFQADGITNAEVSIYYSNANCKALDDCVLIFKGFASSYSGGKDRFVIKVEDHIQNILEGKSLPRYKTYDAAQETIEKNKTAFFPIIYGHNKKAPLIYTRSSKEETVSEIYPDSVFRDDIQIEGFVRNDINDAADDRASREFAISIFKEDQYHGVPDKIYNLPNDLVVNGKNYGAATTGYNNTIQYEFSDNSDVAFTSKRIKDDNYSQGLRHSLQSREEFVCNSRRSPTGVSADSTNEALEWGSGDESSIYMGQNQGFDVKEVEQEDPNNTLFKFPAESNPASYIEQGFRTDVTFKNLDWSYSFNSNASIGLAVNYYIPTDRPIFYLAYIITRVSNTNADGKRGFDYCYRPDPIEIIPFLKEEYQSSEIDWYYGNSIVQGDGVQTGGDINWNGWLSYSDAKALDPPLITGVPDHRDHQTGDILTLTTDGLSIDGNQISLDSTAASDFFKPEVIAWAVNEGTPNPSLRKILWGRRINYGQDGTVDETREGFAVGAWVYGLFPTLGNNRIEGVTNVIEDINHSVVTHHMDATIRFDSLFSYQNPYLLNPDNPLDYDQETYPTLTSSLTKFGNMGHNTQKYVIMPSKISGHNEGWPMLYHNWQGTATSSGTIAVASEAWCPIHYDNSQMQMVKLDFTFNSINDDDVIDGSVASWLRSYIYILYARTQSEGTLGTGADGFNGYSDLFLECDAFRAANDAIIVKRLIEEPNAINDITTDAYGNPNEHSTVSTAYSLYAEGDLVYDTMNTFYMYHQCDKFKDEDEDQWRQSLNSVGSLSLAYLVRNSDPSSFVEAKIKTGIENLELIQKFVVQNISKQKYFGNVKGRIDNSEGGYTGEELSLIEKPSDILFHLMEKELGYSGEGSFGIDIAREKHNNWKFAFSINEEIDCKEFIKDFSKSTKFIPRFRYDGTFSFVNLPEFDEFEFSTINSKDVVSFKYSKTPVSDVKLMVQVNYDYDIGLEEYQSCTNKNNGGAVSVDIDKLMEMYGITNIDDAFLKFNSKYIRDRHTAEELRNHLLEWFKNQHNIIECTLPVSYIGLECGDIVSFDSLIQDTKIFGKDYTQSYFIHNSDNPQLILNRFLVQEIKKSQSNVKIKAIQLHQYSASNILEDYSLIEDYSGFWLDSDIDSDDTSDTLVYLGDWNQDQVVNVLDVVGLVNYIVENESIPTELSLVAGDVNQDGHINVLDVVLIVNFVINQLDLGTIEV